MNRKTIKSTVVRALAAGAMIAGMTAIVSGVASATNPFIYYASPTGKAVNAPCTQKGFPCDLQTALGQEAANALGVSGSEVELLNGNYSAALGIGAPAGGTLTAGNNNALIKGQSASKVFLDAPSGDVTGALGNRSVIDFTGTSGITVQNMIVEGGNGAVENGAGGGLVGNQGGAGTLSGVTLENGGSNNVGVSLVGGATTLTNDHLTTGANCETTSTTSPGVAGTWSGTGFLNIKSYQKCAPGSGTGTVTVVVATPPSTNTYSFTKTAKKTLELSAGAGNPAIPAGSTVVFAAASGAFAAEGIVVAQPGTTATIDPTSVACSSVANPTGPGQVGIAVTAFAVATVSASVSGCANSDYGSAHPLAQPGIGIALTPTATFVASSVTLNGSTSGDDLGVLVQGCFPGVCGNGGTAAFTGGTFGGNTAGVALVQDAPGGTSENVSMVGTSVSGTATGIGLEVKGSGALSLGAPGALNTNTFSGNGVGIGFGFGSGSNTINNATVSGSTAFGVVFDGGNMPSEFSGGGPGTGSNTVENTAFSGNGQTTSEVDGANVIDGNGFAGPTGASLGATCTLHTTSAIAMGSGAPATLALKSVGAGNCTVANGQVLSIAGLAVTLYVNNGAGISHIVAPGSTFTFTVAPIQVLTLTADPAATIASGTAVTSSGATNGAGNFAGPGNTTDNSALSGPGAPDSCNALTAGTAGVAISAVTFGDYYTC